MSPKVPNDSAPNSMICMLEANRPPRHLVKGANSSQLPASHRWTGWFVDRPMARKANRNRFIIKQKCLWTNGRSTYKTVSIAQNYILTRRHRGQGSASPCGLDLPVMCQPLKKREPRSLPQESSCRGMESRGLLEAPDATQLGRGAEGQGEEGAAGNYRHFLRCRAKGGDAEKKWARHRCLLLLF